MAICYKYMHMYYNNEGPIVQGVFLSFAFGILLICIPVCIITNSAMKFNSDMFWGIHVSAIPSLLLIQVFKYALHQYTHQQI